MENIDKHFLSSMNSNAGGAGLTKYNNLPAKKMSNA